MAIRVRKDGTMICAAHSEAEAGDTYIDDGLHYEMSQIHQVITSLPMPEHEADPRWWWSGSSAEAQAEIARLQAEVERLSALNEELDGANIVNRNAIRMQKVKAQTAWNDAIEAAAKSVEYSWGMSVSDAAAAIRALLRPTKES